MHFFLLNAILNNLYASLFHVITFHAPKKTSVLYLFTHFLKPSNGLVHLVQGWRTLVLESHSPADFCFNPNQTHLKNLIKVWRVTRKLQAGEFLLGLELNSAGLRLFKTRVRHPWSSVRNRLKLKSLLTLQSKHSCKSLWRSKIEYVQVWRQ